MRTLLLFISALLVTLIASRVSAATDPAQAKAQPAAASHEHVCKIVTGYGTSVGRGQTAREAKENARLECGDKMIDQYFAQRREIPDSVKDDLALACVNLECQ